MPIYSESAAQGIRDKLLFLLQGARNISGEAVPQSWGDVYKEAAVDPGLGAGFTLSGPIRTFRIPVSLGKLPVIPKQVYNISENVTPYESKLLSIAGTKLFKTLQNLKEYDWTPKEFKEVLSKVRKYPFKFTVSGVRPQYRESQVLSEALEIPVDIYKEFIGGKESLKDALLELLKRKGFTESEDIWKRILNLAGFVE